MTRPEHDGISLDAQPQWRLRERTDGYSTVAKAAWGIALLATLADYLVTLWGLSQPGVYESVWISRVALETAGPVGLLLKDVGLTVVLYALYRMLPRPYQLAVPMGIGWARLMLAGQNMLLVLGVL